MRTTRDSSIQINFLNVTNMQSKLATLILASTLVSSAPAEEVQIPMTPELMQSVQVFVNSSIAVCKKQQVKEEACKAWVNEKMAEISQKAWDICKDYPKEIVPCLQYGIWYLMDIESKKNILTLSYKDA